MKRTFKTVDYDQALELTVRLGDCLPPNTIQIRRTVDSGDQCNEVLEIDASLQRRGFQMQRHLALILGTDALTTRA